MSRLNTQFWLIVVLIAMFAACTTDYLNYNNYGSSGSISGQVTDISGTPLQDVQVSVDDLSAYSDRDGYFYIENIMVTEDSVLVNFTKQDYVANQKKRKVEAGKNSLVNAALSAVGVSTTIDAGVANTVSFQGAEVELPANCLVDEMGNPFTGTAQVSATYFDPLKDKFIDAFPGDFVGRNATGADVSIESYGFVTVSITDGNADLQLAAGSQSTISLPIPTAVLANAPDPIPLWYYDSTLGQWTEEGTANIQNGRYIGKVAHFSSWNCDMPEETCKITGRVVKDNGEVVTGAFVTANGVDYIGSDFDETDAAGRFSLAVKSNSHAEILASTFTDPPISILLCQSAIKAVFTCKGGQTNDVGDLILKCHAEDTSSSRYYDAFVGSGGMLNYAVGVGGRVIFYDNMVGGWKLLAAGTDATLHGICLTGAGYIEGWIVGTNGTVRHSQDYGQTWSSVGIGTVNDLLDVEFSGPKTGLIVGSVGSIFLTNDAGLNWNSVNSGTVQDLNDADFDGLQNVWAVGTLGTILYSGDGGQTWSPQTSGTVETLSGVAFVNESLGWAVGDNGLILKTSNGGQSWQQESSGTLEDLHGIDFAHAGYGKIVGTSGIVLTTEDEGQTWVIAYEQVKRDLSSVRFNGMAGIISGDDQLITITVSPLPPATNGWVEQQDGVNTQLNDLCVISATEAWIAGNQGVVLHTTNAGSSWSRLSTGSVANFLAVDVQGSNVWLADDSGKIVKSDNGGSSWQNASTSGSLPARKIQFINSTGWVLQSDSTGGQMLQSTDGGLSWTVMTGFPAGRANYFADFEFTNEYAGWLIGTDVTADLDYLFKTFDGGANWQIVDSETESGSGFNDLFFINDEMGWMCSVDDFMSSTIDRGLTWNDRFFMLSNTPVKVFYTDVLFGWGISRKFSAAYQDLQYYPNIARTRDGGTTWYPQKTSNGNFPEGLKDVEMADNLVGWAIGGATGFIFYTNTGGE